MTQANLLPMIAERFLNTPLLLDPRKAQVIYGVLSGRIAPEISVQLPDFDPEADANLPAPGATRFAGSRRRKDGNYSLARRVDGVALIDVEGSLVNRGAWIGADSGLTSYEGIAAQIDAARDDAEVHAAIIDIDSPGGEATGMFAIAQKVRQLAQVKPTVAVVNDMAASAAYGIASGASEIVISPTSFTGSIGVVMVHMDHSGEMEKKGVKPTILQKGAQKTYGHPFGALEPEAAAALDKMMTVLYDQFLATVEMGRGQRLSADAARKTEAGIFVGEEAIEAGIADRIGTFDEVLAQLRNPARSGATTETVTMTTTPTATAPAAPAASVAANFTQADVDAKIAAAKVEGATEATARVKAIMEHDEAKGRQKAALTMATDPGMAQMGADSVAAILATIPKEEAPKAETPAPAAPATPEQRATETPEMGPVDAPTDAPQPANDHGWGDVMAAVNSGR